MGKEDIVSLRPDDVDLLGVDPDPRRVIRAALTARFDMTDALMEAIADQVVAAFGDMDMNILPPPTNRRQR